MLKGPPIPLIPFITERYVDRIGSKVLELLCAKNKGIVTRTMKSHGLNYRTKMIRNKLVPILPPNTPCPSVFTEEKRKLINLSCALAVMLNSALFAPMDTEKSLLSPSLNTCENII